MPAIQFTTTKEARHYVNGHSPEYRERLTIVRATVTRISGDTSDQCRADDITFYQETVYVVTLTK